MSSKRIPKYKMTKNHFLISDFWFLSWFFLRFWLLVCNQKWSLNFDLGTLSDISGTLKSWKLNIFSPISLSPLETGKENLRFLFLLSKLWKGIQVSLSPLETGQKKFGFLFLLSKQGKGILISLSLLKIGEREFKFLFLLSKWEKLFLSFSFSSRLGFFASRQWLI